MRQDRGGSWGMAGIAGPLNRTRSPGWPGTHAGCSQGWVPGKIIRQKEGVRRKVDLLSLRLRSTTRIIGRSGGNQSLGWGWSYRIGGHWS